MLNKGVIDTLREVARSGIGHPIELSHTYQSENCVYENCDAVGNMTRTSALDRRVTLVSRRCASRAESIP